MQGPGAKDRWIKDQVGQSYIVQEHPGSLPKADAQCHCTGEKCKFPAANTRHRNINFGSVHRFLLQDCKKEFSSSQLYFKEASQGASSLPGTMVTWAEKHVGSGGKHTGHPKEKWPCAFPCTDRDFLPKVHTVAHFLVFTSEARRPHFRVLSPMLKGGCTIILGRWEWRILRAGSPVILVKYLSSVFKKQSGERL